MSLRNALENWVGVAHLNRQRCQHHVRGAAAVSEFASELRISMQQKTHRTQRVVHTLVNKAVHSTVSAHAPRFDNVLTALSRTVCRVIQRLFSGQRVEVRSEVARIFSAEKRIVCAVSHFLQTQHRTANAHVQVCDCCHLLVVTWCASQVMLRHESLLVSLTNKSLPDAPCTQPGECVSRQKCTRP